MSYRHTYLLFFFLCSSCYALEFPKENIFQQQLFSNKINYIISWNVLSAQTFDNFRMYSNEKAIKFYEVIRSFLHCSWMRIKWFNSRYGYSIRINGFDQVFTVYNIFRKCESKEEGDGFIGLLSGSGGLFVSYNNNGGLYKDKINIGGFISLGLLWSRPYLLGGKKVIALLKDWHTYINFDIVCHLSPIYIQFKDWFYLSINYKFGIVDIVRTFKNRETGNKSLEHLLSGISINLGIY